MSSSEKQQALIQKQLVLNLQNQRMVSQAFGDRTYAPKKPMSIVKADAIREYNKQFKDAQFVTEIDPETGDTIRVKRFVTIPPPELDVVDEALLQPIELHEQDLDDFIKQQTDEITDGLNALKTLEENKREIKDIINNIPQVKYDPSLRIQEVNSQVVQHDRRVKRLTEYLTEIDDHIIQINAIINQAKDDINARQRQEQEKGASRAHNEALETNVAKINRDKVKAYQETLNLLNQGAFQQEKKPGESESDYVQRLSENAQEATQEEDEFQANEFIRSKFKENLKELVRDESLIEQVANELKSANEDNEIADKLLVNKRFAEFKNSFINTFGKKNISIGSGDIIEFIREFIEGGAIASKIKASTASSSEPSPPKDAYITLANPRNNKKVYFMVANDTSEGLHLLWSTQLKRYTFIEVEGDFSFSKIKDQTGLTIAEIKRFLKWKKDPSEVAYHILKTHPHMHPVTQDSEYPPRDTYEEEFGQHMMGWGVKPEAIPTSVPFGNLKLMLHKLYYKNILSIRRLDGQNLVGFTNTPVSDEFVKLLMAMVQGKAPRASEIKSLKLPEMHLYNRLIMISGLNKLHDIDADKSVEHLKHEMKLILGEIESGNDSKKVRLQLHHVVHALKEFGAISRKDALEFLRQF